MINKLTQGWVKIIFISVIDRIHEIKLVAYYITLYRAVFIVRVLMVNFIHGLVVMLLRTTSFFNYNYLLTVWISFFFIYTYIRLRYLVISYFLLSISVALAVWILARALIKIFFFEFIFKEPWGILFILLSLIVFARWPQILCFYAVSFWRRLFTLNHL